MVPEIEKALLGRDRDREGCQQGTNLILNDVREALRLIASAALPTTRTTNSALAGHVVRDGH